MDTNTVITKILIGGNTAVILMSVIILGLAVFYLFSNNIDYASWSRASTRLLLFVSHSKQFRSFI